MGEAIAIKRLEPVILEDEKDGISFLILPLLKKQALFLQSTKSSSIIIMKACNGIKRTNIAEAMQITKLEPVIVEVEKDGKCLSHLILFEIKYNILFNNDEMIVDGDIREVIFEVNERNFD